MEGGPFDLSVESASVLEIDGPLIPGKKARGESSAEEPQPRRALVVYAWRGSLPPPLRRGRHLYTLMPYLESTRPHCRWTFLERLCLQPPALKAGQRLLACKGLAPSRDGVYAFK